MKIIVTDLDGTLLRRDKTISKYTSLVFRRCIDKGIKIVFATARPIRAVKTLNIPLTFDAAIYHNGAVVKTGNGNIVRCGISPQDIEIIVTAVFQNDPQARLCIEIDDKIYGNTDAVDIWPDIKMNLTEFNDLPTVPADKVILLTADMHKLKAVRKILPENLYLEVSENTVCMIMHKEATKMNAIKRLCDTFSIPIGEAAVFGDDYNDIEMLQNCGVGIAVANAIDETKAVADFICDTNDSDGVARWIVENVL